MPTWRPKTLCGLAVRWTCILFVISFFFSFFDLFFFWRTCCLLLLVMELTWRTAWRENQPTPVFASVEEDEKEDEEG
jgi:hypothetical protein